MFTLCTDTEHSQPSSIPDLPISHSPDLPLYRFPTLPLSQSPTHPICHPSHHRLSRSLTIPISHSLSFTQYLYFRTLRLSRTRRALVVGFWTLALPLSAPNRAISRQTRRVTCCLGLSLSLSLFHERVRVRVCCIVSERMGKGSGRGEYGMALWHSRSPSSTPTTPA